MTNSPLLTGLPEAPRCLALGVPALLAITGILLASILAPLGQAAARKQALTQQQCDVAIVEAKLAHKQLQEEQVAAELQGKMAAGIAAADIASLKAQLEAFRKEIPALQEEMRAGQENVARHNVMSYLRPGRHFTWWDGYRYEEIIDRGYIYDSADRPTIADPRDGEIRLKNVIWYPLYPLVGLAAKFLTGLPHAGLADFHAPDGFFWAVVGHGLPTHRVLTMVSDLCAILGAMVVFALARRHCFQRSATLTADGSANKWNLQAIDMAALWTVAFLCFGPDSVFLYSNFTESLFLLLLGCFLFCLQSRWWWRAALVAALAASCRSQGVLFGPILVLAFLLKNQPIRRAAPRAAAKCGDYFGLVGKAAILGAISTIGLLAFMLFLKAKFGNALAFVEVQKNWGAGIHLATIGYAINPLHALTNFWQFYFAQPADWPRLYEAFCVVAPPIVLVLGARYLSLELALTGWMLWGLPYCSTALTPFTNDMGESVHWMSMGRYMAVCVPLQMILGAAVVRYRWLAPVVLALSAAIFAVFAYLHGTGAWLG